MKPNLSDREDKLFKYEGDDRIISSTELAEELLKTAPTIKKLKTGIERLDKLTDGAEAGELVIVTGPTGEGKTTLLMTITANLAASGVPTAWFTLEVTPRQFIQKITRGGSQVPLFYLPRKNAENTIQWVEDRIIEAKVKHDAQAVFIDHIHQIFSIARVHSNISLEIGDMVAKIKQMAIDHSIVIYLIAHSKDSSTQPNKEPQKEDIRDSGLISRLADTIIGVWRIPNDDDGSYGRRQEINEHDNRAKIRVMKNRREGTLGYLVAEHKDHGLTPIDTFGGW